MKDRKVRATKQRHLSGASWLTMGRPYVDVAVGSDGGPGKARGDGWVYLEMMHAEGQVRVNGDLWTIVEGRSRSMKVDS